MIDAEGYLKITDRKKELIITSGGKNIAPQPIENAFNTDPYVEQAVVIGDNRKYISALIVPNFVNVEGWAKQNGIQFASKAELVRDPKIVAFIKERVDLVNATLSRYETIKKFVLLEHEMTEEGGELTPTLKKKRKVINAKYKNAIESMYPTE